MVTIDNKFEGICLDSADTKSKSHITIRKSHNPFWRLLGRPIAVVKCGSCGKEYKDRLFFQSKPFSIENYALMCSCGHTDTITYRMPYY